MNTTEVRTEERVPPMLSHRTTVKWTSPTNPAVSIHHHHVVRRSGRCKHSRLYHFNPCICCCCFGGYCNLRRNCLLIAAFETVAGVVLCIVSSVAGGRFSTLQDVCHSTSREAYRNWAVAAFTSAFAGGCGAIGGTVLLFAVFSPSILACLINIFIELAAVVAIWIWFIYSYIGFLTISTSGAFVNPQTKLSYDDKMALFTATGLVSATLTTVILLYSNVCVIGFGLQIRAGVENKPFYAHHFTTSIDPAECPRCADDRRSKRGCCDFCNKNKRDSNAQVRPDSGVYTESQSSDARKPDPDGGVHRNSTGSDPSTERRWSSNEANKRSTVSSNGGF